LFGQPRVAAIPVEVVGETAHERAALERKGRTRQAARVKFAKAHEGDADL
jgi:hypothetical protein